MAKLLTTIVWGMLLAGLAGNACAATARDEAKNLVKRAMAFVKEHGKDKAFAEFSDPNGKFVKGELYVFAFDFNGVVLAHGVNQALIGKSVLNLRGSGGSYFVQDFIKVGKTKGSGWVEYKWINLATKKMETRSSYLETSGDVIVLCGGSR